MKVTDDKLIPSWQTKKVKQTELIREKIHLIMVVTNGLILLKKKNILATSLYSSTTFDKFMTILHTIDGMILNIKIWYLQYLTYINSFFPKTDLYHFQKNGSIVNRDTIIKKYLCLIFMVQFHFYLNKNFRFYRCKSCELFRFKLLSNYFSKR